MKKVLVMLALFLGTTAMVNAQDKTTQAAPAKAVKHARHAKKATVKAATTVKTETKKAVKK